MSSSFSPVPRVSVIVCTHNPRRDYLDLTLAAVRGQSLPLDEWEVLVVDNGSNPPLALDGDLSWHPRGRVVREEVLGLTFARWRGIHESAGELLVFVDDDNEIDSRYLETADRLAREWTKIGVFGGSQIAACEEPPGPEIEPHLHMLAVRTIREVLWTNMQGLDQATPRGAGFCIRRDLALRYTGEVTNDPVRRMLGRAGGSGLLSGEDTDMAWSVCDAGYGMLVTPALSLIHHLPRRRLQKEYLLAIAEGHAASNVLLQGKGRAQEPALVDRARQLFQFMQAPGFFSKRLILAEFKGKRRGRQILRRLQEEAGRSSKNSSA